MTATIFSKSFLFSASSLVRVKISTSTLSSPADSGAVLIGSRSLAVGSGVDGVSRDHSGGREEAAAHLWC